MPPRRKALETCFNRQLFRARQVRLVWLALLDHANRDRMLRLIQDGKFEADLKAQLMEKNRRSAAANVLDESRIAASLPQTVLPRRPRAITGDC